MIFRSVQIVFPSMVWRDNGSHSLEASSVHYFVPSVHINRVFVNYGFSLHCEVLNCIFRCGFIRELVQINLTFRVFLHKHVLNVLSVELLQSSYHSHRLSIAHAVIHFIVLLKGLSFFSLWILQKLVIWEEFEAEFDNWSCSGTQTHNCEKNERNSGCDDEVLILRIHVECEIKGDCSS